MRILLVGNYELDGQQSMQRYAEWLKRGLEARGHQVEILRPSAFFGNAARGGALKKYLGYVDKYLLFPRRLRSSARGFDVTHVIDHSNSMYLRHAGLRRLITCHDLLAVRSARGEFPHAPTGWSGRVLQRWILSGLRGAPLILCVSEKTRMDTQRLTALPEACLPVARHALNWDFRPGATMDAALRSRIGLRNEDAFLMHVGANQWYKNREGVIAIFAELRKREGFGSMRLVLAGKPWTRAMRAAIACHGLEDAVLDAGTVDNETLRALYCEARALLFPSLEEGFGWPILEAQSCGCAVITSDREPMREIAGAAAIYVNPDEPARAAEIIAERWPLRGSLCEAGFRNMRRFAHEAVMDQYCAVYERVCGTSFNSAATASVSVA